jgi:Uma2 family endonuclease
MVMPETARRYTVEEVLAFPEDGNRYEVVRGELLVSPSPRFAHQRVVARLVELIRAYLRPMGLADCVLVAPADITWGVRPRDAEDLVQPDVFVVPPAQAAGEWVGVSQLVLAAEVVSPSTTRADRVVKRKTYQRHGVATYWVVDPDAALVEVWRPDDERPTIVTETLTWRWDQSAAPLDVRLSELFGPPLASPHPRAPAPFGRGET